MKKIKNRVLLNAATFLICGLLALLMVTPALAIEIPVDEFSTDQATLTLTFPADTGTSTESYVSGGGILGGERDIQITLNSGVINGNTISAGATSGYYSYAQGPTIGASGLIQWDGADASMVLDPTGLGGLDLTAANSQDAFVVGVLADDVPVDVVLDVYTDAGNVSQYTLSLPGGINGPPVTDFVIPFADFGVTVGTGADFSNVGAVVLSITSAGAPDLVLDFVRTTTILHASKSDMLLLDGNSNGQANPGETLEYTVVISNIADAGGSMATNVFFNDTPDANTALEVGSVTTSQGAVTSGNTAGDTVVTVDIGDIPDDSAVTITFQVTVDNPLVGCVAQVSNQGSITYDPAITTPTDDPDTPAVDDTTSTPTFCLNDLGDAPDPSYPTLLSSTGANHVLGTNVYLGACVDAEADGQPSASADGDDANLGSVYGTCVGNDDEDGVTFPAPLYAGASAAVDVVANAPCDLSAWIDFNADGDWLDAGEGVFSGQALAAGANNLSFAIPATAVVGDTYARFRCTTDGAVAYTGQASDGEVEDYMVTIAAAYSLGDLVWYDTDQDGIQDAGEPGVNNINVDLYNNGTCTAPVFANDTTDASGDYGFSGLAAGTYCLQFSNIPAGWTISLQDQGADDALDSDADPATAQITNIALSADDPNEDIGLYTVGSIGDTVWCDANGNAAYDAGEGVAAVTLSLYADTNCDNAPDGAVIATQDTVGDGQYTFTPLAAGPPGGPDICYYVSVDVADMGVCNNPITPIVYAPDLNATTPNDLSVDFGFNQTAVLSSIGDFVWRDDDQNGLQNETGTGIAGVTVNLYECATPTTLYSSTTSLAGGTYSFMDLVPGGYFVECVLPGGYSFSPQDQGGDDTLDSDADPATGRTVCTNLDPGENDPTWDCGMSVAGPAIAVVKTVSNNGWVAPNIPSVVYTLTVTNIGDVSLNPVRLVDTLDPGLSFIPGTAVPPLTSVAGQVLTWDDITAGAGLASGASTQVVFSAAGPATPGLYANYVLVEGTIPTGGVITDTNSVGLLVEDPSVSIDKTLNPPGVVGDLVTFTISIENTGPSAIDVLPLYDTFSGPVIYVGGNPIADSIDNVNQQLLWNDLTVPFGQDLYPGQIFYIVTVFQLTNPTTYTIINSAEIPLGGMDVYTNPINQPRSETAAEIIDLQAIQQGQRVLLNWQTAAEVDTYGFRILRDDGGALSNPVELTFISGQVHGSLGGASYEYWDDTVSAGHTYTYWLMDVDLAGVEVANGPVVVTVNASLPLYLPMVLKH